MLRAAALAAALVVATVAAIEVASLSLLAFSERFPSRAELRRALDEASRKPAEPAAPVGDTAPETEPGRVLHPYIGYVRKYNPGGANRVNRLVVKVPVNEYGFFGPSPIEPTSADAVTVAVTGGSVATELFLYGRGALRSVLEASPAFAGKTIRIVSLALGGFKQPQQLMALSYLLTLGAPFDVVVNLDGFNEVVLPFTDNVPQRIFPYYPFRWRALAAAAIDPETAALIAQVFEARASARRLDRFFSRSPFRQSAFALALWHTLSEGRRFEEAAREGDLRNRLAQDAKPTVQERGPSYDGPPMQLFADSVAVWKRSSLQMWRLCRAIGVTYVHILQPNQYVAGSKPFASVEREVAILPRENSTRVAAGYGYPLLIAVGQLLEL